MNKGTHRQWLPEIIKDAASARIAQIPSNRRSPQAPQDWKIAISTVADTTVLKNSRNTSLNLLTTWYRLLTMVRTN